jgi:hypothetical protein
LSAQGIGVFHSVRLVKGSPRRVPLWLKIAYTLLVCGVIPTNWIIYGPANFLWFSDIALIVAAVALWLENSLLGSMMAVGVVLPEIGWIVTFFTRLLFGVRIGGLAGYMFNASVPLGIRLVSLFHPILPVLLLWLVYRLGYDRRALVAQTILCWIDLAMVYGLTRPEANINWAFGLGSAPQHYLPPVVYLLIVMAAFPIFIYLPTHWVLSRMFGRANRPR